MKPLEKLITLLQIVVLVAACALSPRSIIATAMATVIILNYSLQAIQPPAQPARALARVRRRDRR